MSYGTWDIETTVHTRFKRKANPFIPENWVVTHGVKKRGEDKVTEYRFGKTRPGPGWLKPILEGVKILGGFNIKFDVLHAIANDAENLEAWMDYVAEGGNVWDCQLAEYLLCGMGQRHQMLSLDETAPRYGGNVKVDEVKALWQAGWMTEDIEPSLLSRYLCGGLDEFSQYQYGDVENTEKIMLAQVQRAREAGQLNSILMNMGSLLCTIEMERNGMFVDQALGLTLAAELAAERDTLQAALEEYLPKNLPFEFSWGSRFHKSALIFGGPVNYDAKELDVDPTWADGAGWCAGPTVWLADYMAMEEKDRPTLVYSQMDVECWLSENADGSIDYVPCDTEFMDGDHMADVIRRCQRFKGGKNAGELKTKKVKQDNLDKPKGRMARTQYHFPQITEPKAKWESTDKGVYSVSSEVIEELGVRNIPFLKGLAQLQKVTKDLGTYFIVTDEDGNSKGMLSMVDALSIIHHKINHTSTVTGRFSSSDPNLQNIPKGNKSKVKTVFVSRFGPDGKIIQSDFSALEIYVQANLTLCKQLIADLKAGIDLHCKRLAVKENKDYAEVLRLCKGWVDEQGVKHEKDDEWDYKRTGAKVFSFQRAYGAGAQKISDSTGVPLEDVKALIEAESKLFPEIDAYFEARTKEINQNARPSGIVIPHPDVRGVMCNLKTSAVRTPDGQLYSYQQSPSPEYLVKRGIFASFSPTEIKNYEVQGTGGTWAKAAMWLAIRYFYKHRNFGGLALLVNQVHDALYSDAHNTVARQAAVALHACMEAASDFMEYQFGWTLQVPVPSETTWGKSMMDDDNIVGIAQQAKIVRDELRTLYMNGYVPSYQATTIH